MSPRSNHSIRLFDELRSITFDEAEKPIRSENLTDILEIVAVAEGLKPAHLNGHGFRSKRLMFTLEQIVPRYGLLSIRTLKCKYFRHRNPNYEVEIVRWEDESDEKKAGLEGDVLWIYKTPSLQDSIFFAAAGRISVAKVLGYPECCVMYHHENAIRMQESYVTALRKAYAVTSAADVIRLMEENVSVKVSPTGIDMTTKESNMQFPYVQFDACRKCLSKPYSPASRVNLQMRDLALSLSKEFAKEIWQAHHIEHGMTMAISHKSPCPCGTGKKYKRCCGSV